MMYLHSIDQSLFFPYYKLSNNAMKRILYLRLFKDGSGKRVNFFLIALIILKI